MSIVQIYIFTAKPVSFAHGGSLQQTTAVDLMDVRGYLWLRRLVLPQFGRRLPILPCLPAQSRLLPFHLVICHLSPGWAKLSLKKPRQFPMFDRGEFSEQLRVFWGSDLCEAQLQSTWENALLKMWIMQPPQARKTGVMCKRIDAKVNCTSKDKTKESQPPHDQILEY